jgi:S1-C subfamily serine protease
MKKLFAIAIVTSFLFSGCFSSRLPTTQNLMPLTYAMERRYILVSTTYNWGSAVDIGNGYALTAGHVVYKDGTCDNSIQLLSANGSQGCFVVDTVSDVALLRWPVNSPPMQFSSAVSVGERVYWFQPMLSSLRSGGARKFFLNSAFVNSVNSDEITFTLPVLPSCSGSALFNAHGQIIGIVTSYLSYEVTPDFYLPSYGVAVPYAVFQRLIPAGDVKKNK